MNRLVKETDSDGREFLYKYDVHGNVTEYIDGRRTKFVREYTKTDLLKKEMAFVLETGDKYFETPTETRNYEYDEAGFMKKAKDTHVGVSYNHNGEQYESDAYGNIRSMMWNENGPEMKYAYDLLGRTTSVTTPDGKQVKYSYDRSGLLAAVSGFVKGSIKYEENKSRIQSFTLENGIEKTFNYNTLGNISVIEYAEESKNIKTGFSYLYDNNYNITSRTALDTNKTSWFTYDAAERLTQSQMHGAFETRESLSEGRLSQTDHDLDGTKQAESFFDVLPENIILDTSARSFIYDFGHETIVNKIELFPDSYTHRVRERDIRLYCKESETSDWKEIRNWKFTKNEKNGSLCFAFKQAVNARQVKVRCTWDDRNFHYVSIDTKSTFKGNPQNLLRIWTLEESRIEEYDYDGNSNRIKLTENGTERTYQYYKNKNEGNTPRVMKDGKWWYTYDANGNRTARASKAVQNNNTITIDETKEYWTYTWDLWNRLIKVEQHNAPDNAENVCVEYTYDVLNHRIQRVSKTKSTKETTQYAYGRNGAITYQKKTVGENVTSRSYAYLNNQIVGFTDKEGNTESKYYTVTDIQGSVTEVYDEDNQLVWKSGYTAFGIKAGESTKFLDFDGLYTGCDYDVETGLTYHWNRWRSEDGDSWLSEDPVRDGMNWYGYVGQNPISFTDIDGYSTTRDDWAYQQRIEAENSEKYAKTFELERQAAVNNQGISNVEYNRYNQDGTPKNPGYEDTQNKLNYFVHVFENEQNKIIKKPFKQKVIERKYGYGNFLCLITSILNAYVSDGVVTQRFMDREFGGIIRNNLKTNGCLINFTKYSHQIASALGLDYFYDYAKKSGRNAPLYLSETAFRLSDYKYGIGRFMKPNNYYGTILRNSYMELDLLSPFKDSMTSIDHYGTYRNDPFNDYFNPGVANGIGNYVLYDIIPLVSKKI